MPPKKSAQKPYAKHWLWLGWAALAAGGLYSVMLVGARSPKVQDMLPFADFFRTSLIVHVDLTVLVWLISATSMLWSLNATRAWRLWRGAAFWLAAAGAALIAASPFTGESHPLLNNYVPILMQPVFLFGLILFFSGTVIQTLLALADGKTSDVHGMGLKATAIIIAIAFICLFLSGEQLKTARLSPQDYYEHLFWGGGHVLQLAYTLVAVTVWLLLAGASGIRIKAENLLRFALGLSVLVALTSLLAYGAWPVLTAEHLTFFTDQMKYGGGLSAILVGALLLNAFLTTKRPAASPVRNALYASFLLFMAGGFIALFISGANVTVPAHYHGSIVGISIAMMGAVYHFMPTLGYRKISGKMALIQPWLYGGGQLIHITGLAWSGGYGTLRKTPGAAQSIEGQAAMGLMGLGGLISIIGGLFFVIVIYKAARKTA